MRGALRLLVHVAVVNIYEYLFVHIVNCVNIRFRFVPLLFTWYEKKKKKRRVKERLTISYWHYGVNVFWHLYLFMHFIKFLNIFFLPPWIQTFRSNISQFSLNSSSGSLAAHWSCASSGQNSQCCCSFSSSHIWPQEGGAEPLVVDDDPSHWKDSINVTSGCIIKAKHVESLCSNIWHWLS